ncbi:ribonuclease H-like protein [Mycena polygramma]|nr:ribonuclease H-like protein [Mycena polygramma]
MEPEEDEDEIIVYTDGSATNNGREDARAGSGAFYGANDQRNLAIRVPEELKQSNNVAEILAVKETVESNPKDILLRIKSDSKLVIDGLTKNLRRWEDEGFENTENGHLIKVTAARLRERKAPTTFEWVKGHSGIEGNEMADQLADEGRQKDVQPIIDMQIPRSVLVPGVKLSKMTQSSAYKIIRAQEMDKAKYQEALDRHSTSRNMIYAQDAASGGGENVPTAAQIWKSIRHKDISRSIRYFLWMVIHEGYALGDHWRHFRGFEDRGTCKRCRVPESMEHILTQCDENGQKTVWELVNELWKLRTGTGMPPPLMGEIMACGLIKKGKTPGTTDAGTTRLYRITISESAHLIWRLRNERVLNGKDPSTINEIRNRWSHALNVRIGIDCLSTNNGKYGAKALKKSLVLKTWAGILRDEDRLPPDWSRETRVVVGIG